MTQKKRVHMIGNAHIDPVWLWRLPEGYETVRSTFRSALDRMKETEDFVFTCAQGVTYFWIEQSDPEMFGEIVDRVREGQWELAGGWWVQPDCNIPSGESFIRHALYTQRYFLARFGKIATFGYNVDSFGHNGMLPQLLKKCGLKGYIFFRPGPHEKDLPNGVFRWRSPDGTEILACRPPHHYGFGGFYEKDKMRERILQAAEETPRPLADVLCFYGVGNHGGGPTKENLRAIVELAEELENVEVRFGRAEEFFEIAREHFGEFPVVAEDLQHHAPGCYSVHSEIKRNNRKCEDALSVAERFGALAAILGGHAYDTGRFEEAWRCVLFNQFHDILAGTSVKEAYDDARNAHGFALHVALEETTKSTQRLARRIDTNGEGQAVVLWNPSSWERDAVIDMETVVGWPSRVIDENGDEVVTQRLQTHATAGNRSRVLLRATLPPLGYRVFHVVSGNPLAAETRLRVGPTWIENDSLRIEVDPDTGHVVKIESKTGVSFLSAPACVPIVIDDPTDTWSHGLVRYEGKRGEFGDADVSIVESGPVRATLRVDSRWGDSTLRQDISIFEDSPVIEVRVRIDWQEQFKVLKLAFPLAAEGDLVATYGMPYGSIQKPCTGEEEPAQGWADVSGVGQDGARRGLCLLCPGKYGFDVLNETMRMTVLRSPIYAWHDPRKPEEGVEYEFIDQGRQDFVYWLIPHEGCWRAADPVRRLEELAIRPVVHPEGTHNGDWPRRRAFLSVQPDTVAVGAMKCAEDDPGALILRLFETRGEPTEAVLRFQDVEWKGTFAPHEIKTLRIAAGKVLEVDMLERDGEGGE